MNQFKFFRNLFLILFTSPLLSQLSNDQCIEQLSIFAESAKIKNYQAAYEPWTMVLDNCPKLSLATYQYGEIILKDFIKKSESEEDKSKYLNDLLSLYDQWAENFPERKIHKKGDLIKMIFHPTPWRGLNIILGAMQLIKNDNITLDVFSSTKIYGNEFMDNNDDTYKPLYAQAAELKNVNYRGWHSNDYICKHITDYQIFPYSNNWEETSCISAIEALGAGLHMITTNYGALFETCSEWPVYVQYDTNYKNMSECFAYAIDSVVDYLHHDRCQEHLQLQQDFYKRFYSWNKRRMEWILQTSFN